MCVVTTNCFSWREKKYNKKKVIHLFVYKLVWIRWLRYRSHMIDIRRGKKALTINTVTTRQKAAPAKNVTQQKWNKYRKWIKSNTKNVDTNAKIRLNIIVCFWWDICEEKKYLFMAAHTCITKPKTNLHQCMWYLVESINNNREKPRKNMCTNKMRSAEIEGNKEKIETMKEYSKQ